VSEEIRILLPKGIYARLKHKAEEEKIKINDLILQAIVKILEEG